MIIMPRDDAEIALGIIRNKIDYNKGFSNFYPIWYFTTENLYGLYNNFSFENKDVLTICSSGDHVLNAKLKGANKVDCFDLNILTQYYMFLKMGAIKVLDYEEFVIAFLGQNLNPNTYDKIGPYLPLQIQEFWNAVFSQLTRKEFFILDTPLFIKEYRGTAINLNNNYLNAKDYYDLRNKLNMSDIKFVHSSLIDLPTNLDTKYDLMFLSNLNKCLYDIFGFNPYEKYRDFILNDLSKSIKDNGEIVLAYLYYFRDEDLFINYFKDMTKIISFPCFKLLPFEDIREDRALVYQKKPIIL